MKNNNCIIAYDYDQTLYVSELLYTGIHQELARQIIANNKKIIFIKVVDEDFFKDNKYYGTYNEDDKK